MSNVFGADDAVQGDEKIHVRAEAQKAYTTGGHVRSIIGAVTRTGSS